MSTRKPSLVHDDLKQIRDDVDTADLLNPQAYEIALSPRRTGVEKVQGGHDPDATGERASCVCGGTVVNKKTGELVEVGGRDPETNKIIHVCSPARYKKAGSNIAYARSLIVAATGLLSGIVNGSDYHDEPDLPSTDRDRRHGKTYPVTIKGQDPKDIPPHKRPKEDHDPDHNARATEARALKALKLANEAQQSYRKRVLRVEEQERASYKHKLTLRGFSEKEAHNLAKDLEFGGVA